ncbi:MAG: FKBP-type peptidyl-prolyl cis-trans isomerase [Planctomycetes bacterium]|nr:FKBP-type peptidyl-prolyl cis-trans isomerase [Planctomycetota bacterium]
MLDPRPADSTSGIKFFNENESTNDNQSDQTNDNVDDTDNLNDNDAGDPDGIPPLPAGIPLIPTSSGVLIAELATGEGELLEEGDTIVVSYTGWLDDGTVFDSGESVELPWDRDSLIDGWIDGMTGMRVGGSRRLVIPPELAYGSAGNPPSIPPDATLTFDVDVLEIL